MVVRLLEGLRRHGRGCRRRGRAAMAPSRSWYFSSLSITMLAGVEGAGRSVALVWMLRAGGGGAQRVDPWTAGRGFLGASGAAGSGSRQRRPAHTAHYASRAGMSPGRGDGPEDVRRPPSASWVEGWVGSRAERLRYAETVRASACSGRTRAGRRAPRPCPRRSSRTPRRCRSRGSATFIPKKPVISVSGSSTTLEHRQDRAGCRSGGARSPTRSCPRAPRRPPCSCRGCPRSARPRRRCRRSRARAPRAGTARRAARAARSVERSGLMILR